MIICPAAKRQPQRGTTLMEMLAVMVCIGVAAHFSVYMAASHGRFVGVLVFPLGFCSTAEILCLVGEASRRYGRRKGGLTPGPMIGRSLFLGTISGAVMGAIFYGLGIIGIIPTVAPRAYGLLLSAFLFGMSVDLSFAFVWMLRQSNKKPAAEKNVQVT
jgi:hypothetical protein